MATFEKRDAISKSHVVTSLKLSSLSLLAKLLSTFLANGDIKIG